MHQVIKILCYSKTKEEARKRAEDILNDNLVGEDKAFDYGTFFDEKSSKISGKARWGNLPPVVLANSKEGKKFIMDGMKATKDGFKERIKQIKEMINFYSDEELFEEKVIDIKKKILEKLDDKYKNPMDIDMFKYYCSCVGQYQGNCIWLYGDDGEGIKNNKHLKDVLEKWKCLYEDNKKPNPCRNLKIWVICVDVHS